MSKLPQPANADPELLELWQDWILYRQERKVPLGPVAAKKHLKFLDQWGREKFIQAIETSINRNWVGLFEPQIQAKSQPAPVWAQIKAIEQEIANHPANHESLSFDPTHSKQTANELMSKRKSLYSLRIQQNGTNTHPQ